MTAEPLRALQDGFSEASRTCPGELIEQAFSVGGIAVRTQLLGTDLAHLFSRSLAQDDGTAQQPALTLQLWDEQATGVAPGSLPAQDDGIVKLGAIHGNLLSGATLVNVSSTCYPLTMSTM